MRRALLIAAAAALTACPPASPSNAPPITQFYFPAGVVHVDVPYNDDGILYVANANFDRRFDTGSVVAVDLAKVGTADAGLPRFPAQVPEVGPVKIRDLNLSPVGSAQIASFAGELAALKTDAGVRLFVPTRSEDSRVYALEAPTPSGPGVSPTLSCFVADGGALAGQDCTSSGQSLTSREKTETGVPRAPSPIGVGISSMGEVWFTSQQQADSPRNSTLNPRGFLVHLDGANPVLGVGADGGESSFVDIGEGATASVAIGSRYAFATGRVFAASTAAHLVRMVDTAAEPLGGGRPYTVLSPALESKFTVFEGRGVVLSTDESRLYVATRAPDQLLVLSITGQDTPAPTLGVERSVPLPAGPDQVRVIPRAGRSDLVVVACATAGVLAFYDDDVGDLVGQIEGVGLQPDGIAVDLKEASDGGASGARLYVSNFTDGTIAVIDVPTLTRPKDARIVAYLGATQLCLTRGAREPSACSDGGSP